VAQRESVAEAMAEGGSVDDRKWSMWLRLLSHSVRDTAGSAAADDTSVLQAVCAASLLIVSVHCLDVEFLGKARSMTWFPYISELYMLCIAKLYCFRSQILIVGNLCSFDFCVLCCRN